VLPRVAFDVTHATLLQVVTVGQDFRCCVWEKDQLFSELHWNENLPDIPDTAYRYRACRFGKVPDQKAALCLYTVQIPYKRERRPPPCYITKWDGLSFLPLLTQPCGKEVISCLTVRYVLGGPHGQISNPEHHMLGSQKVYYVEEAHGIVVTDLAFLPETARGRELRGDNEAALLSVAVDSRCKLHLVPNRGSLPVWMLFLVCAVLVTIIVILLQHAFPSFL
ncbi:guanine nucleotide-exchange factor SEC12-like, partial [Ascaphus truei]|uniref:guanine nucleotide-exchange factor SEC12-like n=1 Tax=Ascaphus truei TaxID=8439 RepID=UPI003F5A9CC8